ncbi:NADPH-dependent F420 reductase [Ruegeria sp.]|uniref:NADPH-dependent F420 reductase n=1 Tax=Ruegeria sp. TaxID=1879320 RepID=UPI003C7E5DD4
MTNPDTSDRIIAVCGGTGALGSGLAFRFALAGYRVVLGSRDPDRAAETAADLTARAREWNKSVTIIGQGNAEAAGVAQMVVLAVPYASQEATLSEIAPALQGKILVSATVPLKPPKVARVQLPALGSAAQEAQAQLGDGVAVVSAFQNVAAASLQTPGPVDCDILVTGDSVDARAQVLQVIQDCGMNGYHAGPLDNSAATEALTSLLISINKRHKCHAGIRISGVSAEQ